MVRPHNSNKVNYCIYISILLLISCSGNNNSNSEEPKYTQEERIEFDSCEFDILRSGNIDCYETLKKLKEDTDQERDFLLWSYIMAEEYGDMDAHLDVFNILLLNYVDGKLYRFNEIDSNTRVFMTDFLEVSSDSGNKDAVQIKNIIFNQEIIDGGEKENVKFRKSTEKMVYVEGDTSAYMQLWMEYSESISERFFFWPLLMANKHDYGLAYLHVFEAIYWAAENEMNGFNNLNESSRNFALSYLEIAIERGVEGAAHYTLFRNKTDPTLGR